jgi:DnaJ family protein C protein 9
MPPTQAPLTRAGLTMTRRAIFHLAVSLSLFFLFLPLFSTMQLPKGKSLYDVLEIEKEQVDKDIGVIKKAYRRLALQYHPDKQSKKPPTTDNSTQQFQLVGFAYSILNDPAKRKHYDVTGSLDGDDSFLSGDKDWTDYFKELWQGVVSEETIVAHASKYQGKDSHPFSSGLLMG